MKNIKSEILNLSQQKREGHKGIETWNNYLRRLYLEFSDNKGEIFS